MSASPAATMRMALTKSAASTSLSRKPLAPARSARTTFSSASNVVRTRILGPRVLVLGQAPRGLDAVHDRHPEVHDHDVGLARAAGLDCFASVGSLADHLDALLVGEDHAEAGPHELLVVDEQDPDAHVERSRPLPGKARADQKPVAVGCAVKVPRRIETRSRMPIRPSAIVR